MNIRFLVSFFTCVYLSVTGYSFSQEFVSLNWNKPVPIYIDNELIETELPGFDEAVFLKEHNLPYYSKIVELGKDYDGCQYEVKIEYPEFYPLTKKEIQAIEETGIKLSDYPEVDTEIFVSAKRGMLDLRFIPLVYKEGTYYRINSFKLVIDKTSVPVFATRQVASSSFIYKNRSVLADGKWIKIRVAETGIYEISHSALKEMGFSDPTKVCLYGYGGFILSEDLFKYKIDDLSEVPLWQEDNRVLFYAKATIRWEYVNGKYVHTQNHYSTHGYYFLTEREDKPLEFPEKKSLNVSTAKTITTYPDYALHEKEEYSWTEFGRKLYENLDYKTNHTNSYNFKLTGITNEALNIDVVFAANGKTNSTVITYLDGEEIGNFTVKGFSNKYTFAAQEEGNFSYTGNLKEEVKVTLRHIRDAGISGRLDYIRLNYTKKLALYDNYTTFRSHEKGMLKFIIGNADENTVVWCVSDSSDYYKVEGLLSEGKYIFNADNSSTDEWVVLNRKASFLKPEIVGLIENQNLHGVENANMVIITPPKTELIKQAERLAEVHRQKDGLTVEVVTSQQIYNEFSSGTPDATAYRWFMKMLHDRSTNDENELNYLLLFGDASYDNRMVSNKWKTKKTEDFLLCYSSANSFTSTSSYVLEDYFGFLNPEQTIVANFDNSRADIAVGRIPARTETQAKQIVDKIIDYIDNKNVGPWKNMICFLADDAKDGDAKNGFMIQSEKMANMIEDNHPEFLIKKIYWDAYTMEKTAVGNRYPAVSRQLMEQFDEGMLIMNYTGHGSPTAFSDEYVFTYTNISSIKSSRPPLWITSACEVSSFDASNESMGEAALFHPKGAAIALFSTTRPTQGSANNMINDLFITHLLLQDKEKQLTIGEAFRKSKLLRTSAIVNNHMFVLLGDPAMKLAIPTYNTVVEKINGQIIGSDITIRAGEIVEVEGRIVDEQGETVTGFDGIVYPAILDSKEKITTYNNNKHADAPFMYEDRNKTIFKGSDSIRGGHFHFKFPVPLDINYSFESGMINLYAINETNQNEGQGICTDFKIGGTVPGVLETDSLGPKIKLYLNTPEFMDGGKVNETPYLIAELEDEDGINAVGNGIGHDIIAMIDNSATYTYVLNNYYESILGDYRRGIVRYAFDELPEGKHELLFRAWDIKNNSSTTSLKFEVVKGLTPKLLDVDCTNSPVRDQATFILTHDRPEAEIDVTLSVYDLSGNELWRHNEKSIPGDNYYYIDWDLTSGGGQKVRPGIYVFRASVASSSSTKRSTKSKKIVILD